jgi:hypothetical protein
MGGGKDHVECHLAGSALSATVNYPLWKASAIAQSGFVAAAPQKAGLRGRVAQFAQAVAPPYRGVAAVIGGMTWARAVIFYGSDAGREVLEELRAPTAVAVTLPPLALASLVQFINMPIVRASITMQNPATAGKAEFRTTLSTLRWLRETKGTLALWHGLSAGIAKSVPKYCTSVVVKDACEALLPKARNDGEFLARATVKAVLAGLAGAVLTNPMDVIRNEMFKTDRGFVETIRALGEQSRRQGAPWSWLSRGLYSNLVAVSLPITLTIFSTDALIRLKESERAALGDSRRSSNKQQH